MDPDLARLSEAAERYGYRLIPKARIKTLSHNITLEHPFPDKIPEDYIESTLIAEGAYEIMAKLKEYKKVLIKSTKANLPYHTGTLIFQFQLDIIVPNRA